ncbi:conserved Plasmodium protein, unknown function [Plasmodium gallinaceum]|uniref:Uncharacterized protein n=1 Tax=Plasmodium gallinaceum TaxID=5849 RepID=A0A1J1GUW5_PLAGA|nr:conserved Plasmodium protein, unknown function [Plasmodium gallinaceum]CRG96250.1 conserved Plasmodium protein, unknown function [Plasmodium gallinaceum]
MSSSFGKVVTYYFAIVSFFSAVFLAIVGLMLLRDSESIELHGKISEKVKPSFIGAGIYFCILIISIIMIISSNKKSKCFQNKSN